MLKSRVTKHSVALFLTCLMALSFNGVALSFEEPKPGDPRRAALLDSLRPVAERAFGAPVEFVVEHLRVKDDVAFASVLAQRPGGEAIDIAGSPIVVREKVPQGLIDGPRVQALFLKSSEGWDPLHTAIGPTDVWYGDPIFCERWAEVLPMTCGRK